MTSPVRATRPLPRGLPTVQPAAPRPELRVVGAPPRRSRTGVVLALSTVVVFAALSAGAIAHSSLVTGQVQLDEMGVDVRAERELLQREQLRLAGYQSPARITTEAEQLGMVPAEEQNWVSPGTGAAPVVTGGPADRAAAPGATGTSSGVDQSGGSASELATGTTEAMAGQP